MHMGHVQGLKSRSVCTDAAAKAEASIKIVDSKMSECKAELELSSVKARASAAGSVGAGGACMLCKREFGA